MQYKQMEELNVSRVAMGCMHLTELSADKVRELVLAALEAGINFFDHADIYGGGECERLFADALNMTSSLRGRMILQSKCGIILTEGGRAYFDFSKEHILEAVDGSLKRLKTDYLDVLLLHRPDTLMEPEEIAEAFDELHSKGKVRYFGVSNQNPEQMEFLRQSLGHRILFNQMQFSMAHTLMADTGLTVNNTFTQSTDRDGSTLEYCRRNKIGIQAWSPFQIGFFEGPFLGNTEKYAELNRKIDEIAEKYGVTNTAVAIAWILRHPAMVQAIPGTMKIQRLTDSASGADVALTRREWYELYVAAGNIIP